MNVGAVTAKSAKPASGLSKREGIPYLGIDPSTKKLIVLAACFIADTISEIWGRHVARRAIWIGLFMNVFTKLREKTNGRHLWLRTNVATILCQIIHTAIFFIIAFIGIMPLPEMIAAVSTEFGVKVAMSIIGTPFIYLLVKWVRRTTHERTA